MHDFYKLLPKYVRKGRTNIMDGAEEVVPLAAMAIGVDPNTGDPKQLAAVKKFLLSIRKGVTTITSSNYINDGSAGKIVLGQGWNGDMRRIRDARKKQGDITVVLPSGTAESWADNWCILKNAKHPLAAHAWINNILDPKVAAVEIEYHNYPDADPQGDGADARVAAQRPARQRPGRVAEQLQVHPEPVAGDRDRRARRSTRSSRPADGRASEARAAAGPAGRRRRGLRAALQRRG